jgi:hypothetical protein
MRTPPPPTPEIRARRAARAARAAAVLAAALALHAAGAPAARAQTPAPDKAAPDKAARDKAAPDTSAPLPAAKDVIARYAAAIGGRNALMRHSTLRSTGTFEMPAAGIKGDFVLVRAKPDKMVLTMTIPGLGEMASAYNGAVGWAINPMQGPRVLEGKELAQMREEATFESLLGAGPDVRSLESVARAEMAGQPCVKVKVTYKSGRESVDCYSVDTGLLVGSTSKEDSPMGAVDVTTLVGDWKDFGGLRLPTTQRQQMMGQEQVMKFSSVEYDRPDDAGAFAVPATIQALLKAGPARAADSTKAADSAKAPRP